MIECAPSTATPAQLQQALQRVLRSLVFRGGPNPRLAELPLMQLRCLRAISDHEGARMHDIRDHMEMKMPALSQIVDRLVRRALVERAPDPDDRRAVQLRLSETARRMIADDDAARQQRFAAVFARVDPQAIDGIAAALEQLAEAAEAAEAADRRGEPAADAERVTATVVRPNGAGMQP